MKTLPAAPGYSGTPLARKLGYQPAMQAWTLNAPDDYLQWLAPLPDGVVYTKKPSADTTLVHLFTTQRAELQKELQRLRSALRSDAMLWVSWPKKAACAKLGLACDITEDTIRELALPLGFVDVKVCAVSEVWSGLKLVVRKELR